MCWTENHKNDCYEPAEVQNRKQYGVKFIKIKLLIAIATSLFLNHMMLRCVMYDECIHSTIQNTKQQNHCNKWSTCGKIPKEAPNLLTIIEHSLCAKLQQIYMWNLEFIQHFHCVKEMVDGNRNIFNAQIITHSYFSLVYFVLFVFFITLNCMMLAHYH